MKTSTPMGLAFSRTAKRMRLDARFKTHNSITHMAYEIKKKKPQKSSSVDFQFNI